MAAVPEVEDPGHPTLLVEEEVVEVEVTVHDLPAQTAPLRQDALLVPVDHARDERLPSRLADLVEQRTQSRCGMDVPQQLPSCCRVEERPEREAEAGMHRGEFPQRDVVELRPALAAVSPLEQAQLVAVEAGAWREQSRHGQLRVDGRDVGDRPLLQVERGFVLAAIRDLENAVLEEKGLVALAAERGCGAVDAEKVCRDLRGLVRAEPRRRRVEDRAHEVNRIRRRDPGAALSARPRAFKNPSFERKGSPFCGRIALRCPPTFRRLTGGYCGSFCGTERSRQGGTRGGSPHQARRFSFTGLAARPAGSSPGIDARRDALRRLVGRFRLRPELGSLLDAEHHSRRRRAGVVERRLHR